MKKHLAISNASEELDYLWALVILEYSLNNIYYDIDQV